MKCRQKQLFPTSQTATFPAKALVDMVIEEMPLPARGEISVAPCGRGEVSKCTPTAAFLRQSAAAWDVTPNALGICALFAPGGVAGAAAVVAILLMDLGIGEFNVINEPCSVEAK